MAAVVERQAAHRRALFDRIAAEQSLAPERLAAQDPAKLAAWCVAATGLPADQLPAAKVAERAKEWAAEKAHRPAA